MRPYLSANPSLRSRDFRPRILCALLVLLLSAVPVAGAPPLAEEPAAPPLTASEFAGLIRQLSENGGAFWNDNFVSNEVSYLHPLGMIEKLGVRGGVYLGVGPNQNFTYIARVQPRYAFIIDIRRQNFLQHLLYKAIFHFARNRAEFLSLLLSRPAPGGDAAGESATLEELVAHFRRAEPDPRLYRRNQSRLRLFLARGCRVRLTREDLETLEKIRQAFYARGLSIKYDYIPVPTYGEFLLETDLEGERRNFLGSSEDFLYLKRMQEENRIVPVVGDFAGTHALRGIGAFLKERGEEVTVFYTSNVEQYLVRAGSWPRFLDNVRSLPLHERAIFIRAYWSNYVTHPEGVAGYRFTQILQWAVPFLRGIAPGARYSYWDIVTMNTIKLR